MLDASVTRRCNETRKETHIKLVPLTQDKYALVDDADYALVAHLSWRVSSWYHTQYAMTTINANTVYMHRFILNLQPGDGTQVDHRDGDGLNNQRHNLRVTDASGNAANTNRRLSSNSTTGIRGVTYYKRKGKYAARVQVGYQRRFLGYFDTIEAAAEAIRKASTSHDRRS